MKKSSAVTAIVIIAGFAAWMGFDPGKPTSVEIDSAVKKTMEEWPGNLFLSRFSPSTDVLSRDVVSMTIDRSCIARKPSDGNRVRIWPVTATVIVKSKVSLNKVFTGGTVGNGTGLTGASAFVPSVPSEEETTSVETKSLVVWKDETGSWVASMDAGPSSWTKIGYYGIGILGI